MKSCESTAHAKLVFQSSLVDCTEWFHKSNWISSQKLLSAKHKMLTRDSKIWVPPKNKGIILRNLGHG